MLNDAEHAPWRASLVADLSLVVARYPNDPGLAELVGELEGTSAVFAELWAAGGVAVQAAARRNFQHPEVQHPEVGRLTLDCDVLVVQGTDLRTITYTADPGSRVAEALALLGVLGLQTVS